MRRLEPGLAGLLLALAVLGITLRVLTVPGFTAYLVSYVDAPTRSELSRELALETAEHVRSYVAAGETEPLPAEVGGRSGFGPQAVSHLDDVAAVIAAAGWLTLGCVLVFVLWIVRQIRKGEWRVIAAGTRAAGWLLAGGALGAVAASVVVFDVFFAWFHSLFFEAGTWQFSSADLLIQLFPEPFWILAGLAWGVLVLVSAACLLLVSRAVKQRAA